MTLDPLDDYYVKEDIKLKMRFKSFLRYEFVSQRVNFMVRVLFHYDLITEKEIAVLCKFSCIQKLKDVFLDIYKTHST